MDYQTPAQRKSPRWKEHDYKADGIYFVTLCTFRREILFGDIVRKQIHLSEIGQSVEATWQEIPAHFSDITLDSFVIMPNHVHGLIVVKKATTVGTPHAASVVDKPLNPGSLGAIIGSFKSAVSKQVNEKYGNFAPKLWQLRYYDRVVRNKNELERIRAYILENPARWEQDEYYRASN